MIEPSAEFASRYRLDFSMILGEGREKIASGPRSTTKAFAKSDSYPADGCFLDALAEEF
jgi:hypothetical protein